MSDPTALPNFPPPPNEHPLRGLVLDALKDLGLEPNLDKEGDVSFKANDQQLFVRCLENEVKIMRVFGQWKIADPVPADKVMQLSACNDLNLSMTMVKTGLGPDTLVVTSEHIVTSDQSVKQLMSVSNQIVLATVQAWHERAVKLAERIAEQRAKAAQGADGAEAAPGADDAPAQSQDAPETDQQDGEPRE